MQGEISGKFDSNCWNRRKFIRNMGMFTGVGLGLGVLAACGDSTGTSPALVSPIQTTPSITPTVAAKPTATGSDTKPAVTVPGTPGQQPVLPDTPAGRRLGEWLKAMNSFDLPILQNYIMGNYILKDGTGGGNVTLTDRVDRLGQVMLETRGLTLFSIEQSGDYQISAIVKTNLSESWQLVSLQLENTAPFKIRGENFQPALRPRSAPPLPKLSEPEMLKAVEAFLDKLVGQDAFSGSVLLAKNGRTLLQKAYGLASQVDKTPNQISTLFNVGSVTKMFTGVSVGQLVQQGKLAFTDKVGKFLPDYPNKAVADKVTLDQMLTNSSGMGDFFGPKFDALKTIPVALKDYLPLFVDEPLSFEPGTNYRYSNAGFIVLGLIIEKVSGQSYFDYLKNNIFDPAGMNKTQALLANPQTPGLAVPYTNRTQTGQFDLKNRRAAPVAGGSSAGGSYSTVEDLLKFDTALRQHKLLNAELTEMVWGGKMPDRPGLVDGYGFGIQRLNGQRITGHNGGAPGISAWLDISLDSGYSVAALANYDNGTQPVIEKIRELITTML